jgi:hypothetical protein
MKLRPVQTYPPALLKGRVSGELHAALTAYTAYNRDTTDQAIDLWPLVVQILRSSWTRIGTFRRGGGGPKTGPCRDRRRASDKTGESEAGRRGESIDLGPLVVQILQQFLDTNRD